jgi:hypothetical protein
MKDLGAQTLSQIYLERGVVNGTLRFLVENDALKRSSTHTQYLGLTHISHIQDGQVANSHGSHINMKPRLENLGDC